MKKRVAIYVDKEIWIELRKRCLDLGCSVGDYLTGLHVKVFKGAEEVKVIVPVKMDEKSKAMTKLVEAISIAKESPRERMKRLHPNDMCIVCKELNKSCKCGVEA